MNDGASPATPTRLEPPVTETSRPFWEATRERRLVLQWCAECDAAVFYPRDNCPRCLRDALEWRPASGHGVVYAFSVHHLAGNPFMGDRLPYAVALVELDEGVRMMANIVGCAPDDVVVGMPVAVTWEPLSDGRHLPQFAPRG